MFGNRLPCGHVVAIFGNMEDRMQIEVTSDYRLEDHFLLNKHNERIVKDADIELKDDFHLDCGDVHFINCNFHGLHAIDIGRKSSYIKFSSCNLNRYTPIFHGDRLCLDNCTGYIESHGATYVTIRDAAQMADIRITETYAVKIVGTMPDFLDISLCTNRIDIESASNDKERCSISLRHVSGYGLHIINSKLPNTKLSILKSNMDCMKIGGTELSKVLLDRSVIEFLKVDESQIEQVMSYDSVCHLHAPTNSIKLKLASPPSTFNNSQFTLFKKVFIKPLFGKMDEAILELTVPQNAYVFPPYLSNCGDQSKMRVSKAIPVALYDLDGNRITRLPFWKRIISQYDFKYRYKIWKLATPKEPFDMSTRVCGSGIHGFLTFDEARTY